MPKRKLPLLVNSAGTPLTAEEYIMVSLRAIPDSGHLEYLGEQLCNQSNAISRLIGMLHRIGLLNDAQVFKIAHGYPPEDDPR